MSPSQTSLDYSAGHHDDAAAVQCTLTVPPSTRRLPEELSIASGHHALEISVNSQKVTMIKSGPLNPQLTSVKGTIEPAESGGGDSGGAGGVSPSQQAADSIRKLYDLTFVDGGPQTVKKERNTAAAEEEEEEDDGKEGTEEQDERDTASLVKKKEETTKVGTSPFQSFRKSFKLSPRHKTSKPEASPELLHYGNSPLRRKTFGGAKVERPKFYLRDILPVLQEKNKLKEQVHLLECEIESLKRYIQIITTILHLAVWGGDMGGTGGGARGGASW